MTAIGYLNYLQQEINTVVAAVADDEGLPVTCAIDIMDADEEGVYFLTAKGKGFYTRLKNSGYIALTGVKGQDTMSRRAVSVRGKVRELGSALLPRLFEKNPYMNEIYPTQESVKALTVFQMYQVSGEWFDLSQKPIVRDFFYFGGVQARKKEYFITGSCNGCRACETVCPQNCIDFTGIPAVIRQEHCLHCGNCRNVCPQKAVIREE